MEDLTQTISNLVGILLGIVGTVGEGFFIYGAYLYLTASGAPHQMERGKSAMLAALAGVVLVRTGTSAVGSHSTSSRPPSLCRRPSRSPRL